LSATNDESRHLVRGYALLETLDFRLNIDHPPVANLFDAIPLAFMDLEFDFEDEYWKTGNKDFVASEFFASWNNEKIWEILFFGRAMNLLFFLGTSALVFFSSRKIFGTKTSWIAFFFTIFSPNLIGHGAVVSTDMSATFFATAIFSFIIFHFYEFDKIKNIIILSFLFTLSIATKYSLVVFSIIIFVFLLFLSRKNFLRNIILIGLLTIFFLAGIYQFKFQTIEESFGDDEISKVSVELFLDDSNENEKKFANWFYKDLKIPYSYFLRGFLDNGFGSFSGISRPRTSYLFGRFTNSGFREFFVSSFLLKTPIYLPIFFGIYIFRFFKFKNYKSEELFLLSSIFFLYFIVSIGKLNLGYRHIMIAEPAIIILSASIFSKKSFSNLFYYFLMIFGIVSVIKFRENLISYTNEIVPEKERFKVFNDSNLEWGQNEFFARYFSENMNKKNLKTEIFTEKNAKTLKNDFDGYVIVSANYLIDAPWHEDRADFLISKEPIYVINGSFYVFEV